MRHAKRQLLLTIEKLVEFSSRLGHENTVHTLNKYYDLFTRAEKEALVELSYEVLDALRDGHSCFFGVSIWSEEGKYLEIETEEYSRLKEKLSSAAWDIIKSNG